MPEYRYKRFLPLTMLVNNDREVFAALCPQQHGWLHEHNVSYEVTCYRWPEMVSRIIHGHLGMTACEINLTVDDPRFEQQGFA